MDSFEDVVSQYAGHISPGKTVVEITSVKVGPVAAMHRHLKTNKVLGIHPMFGPGAKDFAGHNFILTPTNQVEEALSRKIEEYIKVRGGNVTVSTPEEHDRLMSIVLGLPHLVALVAAETLLELGDFGQFEKIGGTTCRLFLTFADSVLSEDPELYASLQMNLADMTETHGKFQKNLESWVGLVAERNKKGFIDRMRGLAEKRAQTDPDFKRAYRRMYSTLGHQG
jgi:prephenate dehydrogenase